MLMWHRLINKAGFVGGGGGGGGCEGEVLGSLLALLPSFSLNIRGYTNLKARRGSFTHAALLNVDYNHNKVPILNSPSLFFLQFLLAVVIKVHD